MNSATNTLRVIDVVAEHPGLGVSDIARLVGLPKSTAQRCLLAAAEVGWITETGEPPTRWSISMDLLTRLHGGLGMSLREAATGEMRTLASRTGQAVHLVVRRGDDVVLLERVQPRASAAVVLPAGHAVPLHAGATGKAILAALDDVDVEAYLRRPMVRLTERTLDQAGLRQALSAVRRDGWAINLGEWSRDVVAVASAIAINGRAIAAVSISSTVNRLSEDELRAHGPLVAAAAARIGSALATSREDPKST